MKNIKINKYVLLSLIAIIIIACIFIFKPSSNNKKDILFELREGLNITKIGSYDGLYVEDGSNEKVSSILMIEVTNTTDKDLQYTEIVLQGEKKNAYFSLSTLPAGESMYVLESQKLNYDQENYYSAYAQNTVFFNEKTSMYKDQFDIETLNGAFNVTNKSNEDINGVIYIYYKNVSDDQLFGGITYRVKIDGLKSKEIKQVMANHYSIKDSQLMFVTVGE